MNPIPQTLRRAGLIGLSAFILLAMMIALIPINAHAIDFPTIPGVPANSDPITMIVKVSAFIFKAVLYIILVASFAVGAYVAISTLIKMVKDRDNAGDLVGRLMASIVVVIVSYWFLSEGEKAADELSNITVSVYEVIEQHTHSYS